MEKYSDWRDASTGVQPFLPPKPLLDDSTSIPILIFQYLASIILRPVLAIVRIALFVVAVPLVLYPVFSLLSLIIWIFSTIFSRKIIRVRDWVCGRLTLLLLGGFHWISTNQQRRAKSLSRVNVSRRYQEKEKRPWQDGDLIVCNHASYWDYIFWLTFASPLFAQVYADATDRITLLNANISDWLMPWSGISVLRLVQSVADPPLLKPNETTMTCSLVDAVQFARTHRRGPIVIFTEGTTSNGRAVLSTVPIFDATLTWPEMSAPRVYVWTLRYLYRHISPTYTAGNILQHFWQQCCQFYSSVEFRQAAILEWIDASLDQHIMEAWTNSLRCRRVGFSMRDKVTFLQYYARREQRGAYANSPRKMRDKQQ